MMDAIGQHLCRLKRLTRKREIDDPETYLQD